MAEPTEPPPLVGNQKLTDAVAEQDAQDDYDWELYEARQKTKELRALFANRVYIDPDGKHLRISFGERIGDEDAYHTSIVMPLEEAYQVGDLITRMAGAGLTAMWDQIRQAISTEPPPPPPQGEPNG